MAEHHQQYMRPNPLRLFPEGSDMDPASAAAAAAAMFTEKARNALGLPPSPFWAGGAQQANNVQASAQRARNPLETAFQPFVNPSAAAAAAAMSQLYSRNGAPPGMIPPPHFWSQFYGLNHQLGLLSGLAGNLTPVGPESAGSAGSPPSPSSMSPAGTYGSHQRYSPYSMPGAKSQMRTPSPRNQSVAPPSPK